MYVCVGGREREGGLRETVFGGVKNEGENRKREREREREDSRKR